LVKYFYDAHGHGANNKHEVSSSNSNTSAWLCYMRRHAVMVVPVSH